ncbi:MAG: baseplate J/gp47 family protein [Eubacteriales bacterium]|nr:baseplate J/gp47 family protein [Eubacteriales bacterium]
MLNPKKQPEKTHAGLMEEAVGKIPVYSGEWTNFNPSDPGITILENLAAFQLLQHGQMDIVTDKVREGLLRLMGYTAQKGKCARVLLEASGLKEPVLIPADQRFMVGDVSFETALAGRLTDNRIVAVYAKDSGGLHNHSYVLDRDIPVSAQIFSGKPAAGMELYLVLEKAPEPGEELLIHVKVGNRYKRNPFREEDGRPFAVLSWACYTKDGFAEIKTEDKTHAFLEDGEIRFTMPEQEAARYEEEGLSGYVWRASLTEAQYDVPPELLHISGFLFEAWQKETLAITYTFQKPSEVLLACSMMEEGYVRVYCKEEKGSSYRLYEEENREGEARPGRYYRTRQAAYGVKAFRFDRRRCGFGPGRVKNAVKIVVYNEEMMRQYYLGEVLGCDDQRIRLPREHIVPDTFSLMAVREDGEGGALYDFVKPGRMEENALSYRLYEEEGQVVILDAGDYIGAKLYLASLAVTMGEEGNVRPGNQFLPRGYEDKLRFTNPARGEGGCFQETTEQVRRRFVRDLYTPHTAVWAKDYEALAYRTPGLCIRKAHAWMDDGRNEVQIAVCPNTPERFPGLSDRYRERIGQWLEERRMLSARVSLRQPVYEEVNVRGHIYVKPHYENGREQIEEALRRMLDYVQGEQGFGERLQFEKLFLELEALECVAQIYDLSIRPASQSHASMEGTDIVPEQNCLLCPGQIRLEIDSMREAEQPMMGRSGR